MNIFLVILAAIGTFFGFFMLSLYKELKTKHKMVVALLNFQNTTIQHMVKSFEELRKKCETKDKE